MTDDLSISDLKLRGYVDGRLDDSNRSVVERYLQAHPEERRRIAAYVAQKAALRAAYATVAQQPLSWPFKALRRRQQRVFWLIAAVFVLALGSGGAGGWLLRVPPWQSQSTRAIALLKHQALTSYSVYASDPLHPVEFTAAEFNDLTQWLSGRLHRNVRPPDLAELGYRLLGGRLLPTERGTAAALFMYDDNQGHRLSILVQPMRPDLQAPLSDMSDGAVNGCAWIAQGLGYAVVAAVQDSELDRIAGRIMAEVGKRS